MSGRVAMFTPGIVDFISAPLINSAEYLGSQGYRVDIFAMATDKFAAPVFASPNISYVPYRLPEPNVPGTTFLITPYRLNRLLGRTTYEFFIGFDPPGLVNAALLGKRRRTPYVYHSLEIASESTLVGWQLRLNKRIERWLNRGAALTITQDEHRADILARENHLDRTRVVVVHNSPLGEPMPEKSLWLRNRFEIPSTKYVVLGVGSLIEKHMVDLIADTVESWPDHFVLVLHGWFSDSWFSDNSLEEKVRRIADKHPNRLFISTTLLPHRDKYLVFQSADIGLVFFKPVDDNHRYVGAAAGKLFDFMRCGVPMIAIDLPGMKELVCDSGAGVVVNDVTEIPEALLGILHDYSRYSERSLAAFSEYDFARSYERALARIPHNTIRNGTQ